MTLTKLAFSLSVAGISCFQAHAQTNPAQPATEQRIKVVSSPQLGETPVFKLDDGRSFEIRSYAEGFLYEAPLTLSENSCSPQTGLRCRLFVPMVQTVMAGVWKDHPTQSGKVVQIVGGNSSQKWIGTIDTVNRFDRNFNDRYYPRKQLFEKRLTDVVSRLRNNELAWIECERPLQSPSHKITYWDENFERGNEELQQEGSQTRQVNMMSKRFRNIGIRQEGTSLSLSIPKNTSESSFGFDFPAIAYQLVWHLASPNLIDKSDTACSMKWDIHFSVIFPQVLKIFAAFQNKQPDPARLGPHIYIEADQDLGIFDPKQHESRRPVELQ